PDQGDSRHALPPVSDGEDMQGAGNAAALRQSQGLAQLRTPVLELGLECLLGSLQVPGVVTALLRVHPVGIRADEAGIDAYAPVAHLLERDALALVAGEDAAAVHNVVDLGRRQIGVRNVELRHGNARVLRPEIRVDDLAGLAPGPVRADDDVESRVYRVA